MTIVDKIKQLCESVTGLPFLYDSMGGLNVLLDNADYPCVYCTLLETTSVTNENGNIVEGVRVALVVCDKTEFDVGSIENESIIADCKAIANNILRNIRLTGALVLDSINEAQRFYEQYDVLLTGYALNLNVSEIYGDTGCDIEPITLTITENGEYDVTGVQKAIVDIEKIEPIDVSALTVWSDVVSFDCRAVRLHNIKGAQMFDSRANLVEVKNCEAWNDLPPVGMNTYGGMRQMFYNCPNLERIGDLSGWRVETNGVRLAFGGCPKLNSLLDLRGWEVSQCTSFNEIFTDSRALEVVDLRGWVASQIASGTGVKGFYWLFVRASALWSVVGGESYENVVANNDAVFVGINVTVNNSFWGDPQGARLIDRASTRALINGLSDRTGQTACSFSIGNSLARLGAEDLAIATAKNWNLIA